MELDKHYNLDYIRSISNGDEGFVSDMILTFISNVPEELNKIKSLVDHKNWKSAGQMAHKFASNLLLMEIKDLIGIAIEIEENGLNDINVEKIPDLYEILEKGCYQIINELRRDFNV